MIQESACPDEDRLCVHVVVSAPFTPERLVSLGSHLMQHAAVPARDHPVDCSVADGDPAAHVLNVVIVFQNVEAGADGGDTPAQEGIAT